MHIGERIKQRREELHMSMDDLAQKLGYKSRTSIFKIESGDTDLPLSKVEEFAAALFVTPQYLMGWEDNGTQSDVPYYLDEETAGIAQEVYDRPELKILFDASRKASKEDIQFVVEMIDRMARKERGED